MNYNILVVEDDTDILNLLKLYLKSNGYEVYTAGNGIEALKVIEEVKIDLALLDIMMPEMDGYELIMKLRKGYNFPVIFISAKSQDSDKIVGLNLGADDYICKPFNPLEVVARVKANLRRDKELSISNSNNDTTVYQIKDIKLYTDRMIVEKNGVPINLTPTEFRILALLIKEPGRIFTKAQIYEHTTGEYLISDENSVMVHISKLREKLGDDSREPIYIKNIRGLGYKIEKDN